MNVRLIYSKSHMLLLKKIRAVKNYNKDNSRIEVFGDYYTSCEKDWNKE